MQILPFFLLDLPPGRMPNALNIHYQTLLDPITRTLKSKEDLRTVFHNAGVDLDKPLISTCGKGNGPQSYVLVQKEGFILIYFNYTFNISSIVLFVCFVYLLK